MEAAISLAMQGGAHAITVAAVAAKAGLARSSVYEYFDSSADLIAELIIEELDYYSDRLAKAIADVSDPFEKIEKWIAEGLQYVADGRHMLVKSLNTIETPENRREEIAVGHRRLMAPLRHALIETKVKDPKMAGVFLQSITDAASMRIDAGSDAQEEINSATVFALAGLRALV
jgi:AcrR family transcriptional regulator